MRPGAYERLPAELKELNQWALAGPNKAPHLADKGKQLYLISVHATELYDFETARTLGEELGCHIGFILRAEDPFTCIDLDVKDQTTNPSQPETWTKPEVIDGYINLIRRMETYTERSMSGRGLHVWARGFIGAGVRRDGVEVYSQERFIICTGDVYINAPVMDRQIILAELAQNIRKATNDPGIQDFELVEIESELSDKEIVGMAQHAVNAEKFEDLCRGDWQKYPDLYPSQSEADNALIAMFAFYSPSNEQVRRLFKMSALGKREKATEKYINYALRMIRYRQAKAEEQLQREREQAYKVVQERIPEGVGAVPYAIEANPPPATTEGLDWPPGLIGVIAAFIYNSSPRPVKEVAIVAALGLIAGICGKTYHVTQSGLNLYLILVARSAIGKEAMHSGISLLLSEVRAIVPGVQEFVDFSDFASGPALVKACAKKSSFVNVAGEWGRKLRRLSEDRVDGPMQQLRTVMTNLYQKSGPASIVGGLSYSNKDQNIESVAGVAYSMIGETTPGTFYESLTRNMMEDGFLSRFNIIEYEGKRPPANNHIVTRLDPALLESLCALTTQSLTLLQAHQYREVQFAPDALQALIQFDKECDEEINKTDDESYRQMWNRAHLKVNRIAALLAVADNWIAPIIQSHHVDWSLSVVMHDIEIMQRRMQSGDVGSDDFTRELKVLAIVRDYLENPIAHSYQIPDDMRQQGLIPRRYIQQRASRQTAFANHKMGARFSIKDTLQSLVDTGYLADVPREEAARYGPSLGKCYRILSFH